MPGGRAEALPASNLLGFRRKPSTYVVSQGLLGDFAAGTSRQLVDDDDSLRPAFLADISAL